MATPITNFGLVTVDGLYNDVVTSVTLEAGEGSRLPVTTGGYTYPMTWWNATDYAHPADDPNVEIVLVTARATDTLSTIVRAQEGTAASTKNSAGKTYRMSLGITKAMWESLRTPTQFHQGLQLQTHRDSDLAPYQVELVDVDSIIMDDGVELRNDSDEWTGKVADITVSGAGGLDTGVEEVGTLYEIYAIAKEDSTRNLLLHKSKIWSTDTGYASGEGEDATQGIRSAVDNSTVKVAQGFQFNGGRVPYIEVKLIKVGTPTGKIWFTIETDNAGKPSGTAVATSQAYDVARLSTTAMLIRIPMKSSEVLSAIPTQYHLVAQGTWTVSAVNYVGWRMDGSAADYTLGSKALYDSDTATWTTDTDDDMVFVIGAESSDSAVTMPTGYTKKCFLGWVLNDGSGNFIPFLQVGRTNQLAQITNDAARIWSPTGVAEVVSLIGFLPPRHLIKAMMGLSGTGTGGAIAAIGDLRATDISSAGDSVGAQAVLSTPITTTIPSVFREVLVQTNAVMVHGTAGAYLFVTGYEWD
jgi:hypothetical protein